MEENYSKILWEGYGLRLHTGGRTRTGFVCKTDKGLREVRKTSAQKDSIQFEQDTKEHLYEKGFRHISRFCPTIDGKAYYTAEGNQYVVEIPVNGDAMEETETGFIQGAGLLGAMHKAGQGLKSSVERSNLGQLPVVCVKRKNELGRIHRRIEHQSCFNSLDLMVMEHYHAYMERLQEAEKILSSRDYQEVMQEAEKKHTFCHNMFKGDNIRCEHSGVLGVTGFNKCAYDSPLTDLTAYFRRYIKKTDGSVAAAEKMLQAYEKEYPLSEKEHLILVGLLTYPEKFLRLCNEYYNKRRVCVSPAVRERMKSCIESQAKSDSFILELRKMMGI